MARTSQDMGIGAVVDILRPVMHRSETSLLFLDCCGVLSIGGVRSCAKKGKPDHLVGYKSNHSHTEKAE
jgi:hypothetical protein